MPGCLQGLHSKAAPPEEVLAPGFSRWEKHPWGRGLKASESPGCQSDLLIFFSSCFLGQLGVRLHVQLHLPGGMSTLEGLLQNSSLGHLAAVESNSTL